MNVVNPAQRYIAGWLLTQELGAAPASEALPDALPDDALPEAAERACQKLGWRLARLVTLAGYQALLARALRLASDEFPFLDGVQAGALVDGSPPDACLRGLRERVADREPATVRAGLTAVLANVIGLLATFIGEDLALRLVRDVWPDAQLVETDPPVQEI